MIFPIRGEEKMIHFGTIQITLALVGLMEASGNQSSSPA